MRGSLAVALLLLLAPAASSDEFKTARLAEGVARAPVLPKDTSSSSSSSSPTSPLSSLFALPPSLSLLTSYCNSTSSCPLTQLTHERVHYAPANASLTRDPAAPLVISYSSKSKAAVPLSVSIACPPSSPPALDLSLLPAPNGSAAVEYLWRVPVPCELLLAGGWVEGGHERMLEKAGGGGGEKEKKGKGKKKEECCPCKK
ncbi:hypothetical protein TeGR_g9709 [Tetraparma gracilis]|uniref:Uncharacterized protein n=1 Tax=Tetraparma gracilis TaxID=2962635 RepID=A0ABQ6M9F9_9STRA|nr:hypothetical protein TeGR_g9709 [Tetraparma gracilis]